MVGLKKYFFGVNFQSSNSLSVQDKKGKLIMKIKMNFEPLNGCFCEVLRRKVSLLKLICL